MCYFAMIFIRKWFNNNSQSNKIRHNFQSVDGILEKDAAPVKNINEDVVHSSNMSTELSSIPNEVTNPNNSNTLISSEINTMNVHNANQQVVLQFSNVNKLHIGSVFNINNSNSDNKTEYNEKERRRTKSKDSNYPRKTTSIEAMMQSKEEPKNILIAIATHLGIGWKQVMRELGFSEGQISSTYLDHHIYGTKERLPHAAF